LTETPDADSPGEDDSESIPGAASTPSQQQQITLTNVEAGGDVFVSAVQVLSQAASSDSREAAEALIEGPLKIAGVDDRAQLATEQSEAGRHLEAGASRPSSYGCSADAHDSRSGVSAVQLA